MTDPPIDDSTPAPRRAAPAAADSGAAGAHVAAAARWLLAAATAALVTYLAWRFVHGPRAPMPTAIRLTYLAAYALPAALCVLAARRVAGARRAAGWWAVGLGIFAVVAAVLEYRLTLRWGSPHGTWIADLLAMLYYPAASAALVAMAPVRHTRHERLKFLLDLAIVLAAVLAVFAYLWLRPVEPAPAAPDGSVLYVVLIPLAVFVVLYPSIVLLLRRGPSAPDLALGLLLAGIVASALVDGAHYAGWGWAQAASNMLWPATIYVIGLAAYFEARRGVPPPPAVPVAPARGYSLLPYHASAVVGVLLLVALDDVANAGMRALVIGAVTLCALLVARHLVALRENGELTHARLVQETRFRALVQRSADAVLIVDRAGTVAYHTPALAGVFGVPAGDYTGASLLSLVGDAARPQIADLLARISMAPGNSEVITITATDDDRRTRVAELLATNRADDGAIRGIVMHARDITERHVLEQQLHQAQKMEAVGRLAGGIAHDFNNLLTAINGYAELLEREFERGTQSVEDVREIRRAGRRAAELTRQLLAFSRRQPVEPRVVSLHDVVAGVERMLRRLLGSEIQIVTALRADPAAVRVDPGQIEQVVVNLALNGRDAMPDGGTLTLATDTADLHGRESHAPGRDFDPPPGRYVVLAVGDTGIGMPPETVRRLFEPFFTTKGEGKGTGLGLATVYGIVTQSGGHIRVDSEPGCGSTFRVFLPVAGDATPAGTAEMAAPPRVAATAAR